MPGNKTYFNLDWINPEINPEWANWLQADPNSPFSAYCVKCRKKFGLGNMGKSAIKKHASGEHHKKILISENSCLTVSSMFEKNTFKSEDSSVIQTVTKSSSDSNKKISANTALDDFVIKNNVTSAEILWAIRLILKHDSYNSCEFDNYFFKRMFVDSEISNKFSMGPDKAHYLITYGLSPYFESLQKAQLLKSEAFVICFDEAINKIAQKGQMDLHVRFWCESNQQVSTRYLNSAFLGKAAAENMLESFLEIMNPFSLEKILQVSMDGPNVNFKFLKLLKSHMESMNEDSSKLLDIGSCGLHVINGAFQTGCNETGWKVRKFLLALYYLFKDSPSRRAEYSLVTGCSIFPKKFCQIRWLENASCAERAMMIFQNVKEYIAEKKIISNGNSATTVEECLRNPLMLAQLAFFKLMSEEFQPFLTRFQTAEPLSPYLYTSVLELTKNLMRRFVKKNVLDNATTAKQIAAIDLTNKENLVNIKELDIGFSTTQYLNKSKVSD